MKERTYLFKTEPIPLSAKEKEDAGCEI